jgi:diguanylate cyclase (GGDEF)-like protein
LTPDDLRGDERDAGDPLTGLPLRQAFLEAVAAHPDRAEAGFLCADVDGLRALNDAAGRETGDAVIAAVGAAVADALDPCAIVARDAGGSFSAFVPGLSSETAASVAESVSSHASDAASTVTGTQVTVSVGVALGSDGAAGPAGLLRAARRAARAARDAGGGGAVLASDLGPPEGPDLVLERLPCPDFVGRDREVDAFRERLQGSHEEPGFLFVRGEPGSGKTRLLRELVRVAREEGTAAAYGSCRPTDPARPFAVLARALSDYADAELEARDSLLSDLSREEIEVLLPLFSRAGVPLFFGGRGDPKSAAVPEKRRRLVMSGIFAMLRSAAEAGGLALFFDEVTWLDAASIEILRRAAEEGAFSFVVVGAFNERAARDPSGRLRPAAALFQTRGSASNVWETRLRRLGPEDAARMISGVLPGRPNDGRLDEAVFGVSGGNPSYIEGLLRWLAIHRQVTGAGDAVEASFDPAHVPRTLDALIDATVGILPDELAHSAMAAAAAGRPAGPAELSDALGLSEAECQGSIDWLLRLALFEPAGAGGGAVSPASTRIAERAAALAEPDFIEPVHAAYAERAAGSGRPAEEAYHLGFTADAEAAERARAAARTEAQEVWSGTEAAGEPLPPGPPAGAPSPQPTAGPDAEAPEGAEAAWRPPVPDSGAEPRTPGAAASPSAGASTPPTTRRKGITARFEATGEFPRLGTSPAPADAATPPGGAPPPTPPEAAPAVGAAKPAATPVAPTGSVEKSATPPAGAPRETAPEAGAQTVGTQPARQELDALGPEAILDVEGIPAGGGPIRFRDEAHAGRILAALDGLLERNERATASAVIWRIFSAFEVEDGNGRKRLAGLLPDIESCIWHTRLVEAYKALEDTLDRELKREEDPETLDLLARSAARAVHAFLLAGQYSRIARLGSRLMRLESGAGKAALSHLSRTDFFDLLMSDLASESAERSLAALAALEPVAAAVQDRLVDVTRTSPDYRLRHLAARALASSGPGGGVRAIAQIMDDMPEEEYENIISIVDALGLEQEVAEDEIVAALNYPSERVRRAAVSVAYRMPSASALGILQHAIDEGGALGGVRTLHAIGELRLVPALPIVHKQLVDSQDSAVIRAGARALGRMATDPDVPALSAVKLLAKVLERLPSFADDDEGEHAALAVVWALGQYSLPEARAAIESAKSYPSVKVAAAAAKALPSEAAGGE